MKLSMLLLGSKAADPDRDDVSVFVKCDFRMLHLPPLPNRYRFFLFASAFARFSCTLNLTILPINS